LAPEDGIIDPTCSEFLAEKVEEVLGKEHFKRLTFEMSAFSLRRVLMVAVRISCSTL